MKIISKYFIWILIFLLIVFRYFSTRPTYKNGDTIRITSVVYSDPIVYPNSRALKIAGLKIYLPLFPEIFYGDRVVIEGNVNNGKLDNAKLIKIENGKGFGSGIREKIIEFYNQCLPQPMSGLISGITLGSKGNLTSGFWESVKKTGVAHIVVASGTNITFVVSFVFGIVNVFLPRRKSIPIVILSIILYLFISGFEAPLIRASIMAFLTFTAQETGRLVQSWRVLLLSAGLMLIIRPDWITDIGFILSFVSVASIMLFQPKIEKIIHKLPVFVKKDLSVTLSAQIGVAPIIFATFGQFNLLSPIVNLLVLWTVPFIMILGAIGGIIGLIVPFLGKLILYIAYPLLLWFVKITYVFG